MSDTSLAALRDEIDTIDAHLVELLARRFAVTKQVGRLKKQLALPPVDAAREANQSAAYRAMAAAHGLPPAFVESVFRLVIDQVVAEHRKA